MNFFVLRVSIVFILFCMVSAPFLPAICSFLIDKELRQAKNASACLTEASFKIRKEIADLCLG